MDGYLLLVGGPAASAEDDAVASARAVLAERAPVEVVTSAGPRELHGALDDLGDRTLVIVGGDGSIHVVVDALDRRGELAGAPLGLVPVGTGNDLARTLGIPLDPAEAARRLRDGTPRPLDLIRTGEGTVVNAAHAGIGVDAAERAADLKDALGPLAYPVGAVGAGVSAAPLALRVEVDGEPLGSGDLLAVGVGNGRTVGGGAPLFPDADPRDGLLDVIAVAHGGVWDRLRLGLALRDGEHGDLEGVHVTRGREVLVTGTAAWDDDGELGDPLPGRQLRVEPAAWRLLG